MFHCAGNKKRKIKDKQKKVQQEPAEKKAKSGLVEFKLSATYFDVFQKSSKNITN